MMNKFLIALTLVAPNIGLADGCGGAQFNYEGVWFSGNTPTANYVVSLPNLNEGSVGCYWIEATPQWGIEADSTEVLRIVDEDLQGGVLIAVARSQSAIDSGDNAWIWINSANLSQSSFSEMYFNRQTLGKPRN